MRIGNVKGRPWLITGQGAGIDIGKSSGGRFGTDLPGLYENWLEFTIWAKNVVAESTPFNLEDLEAPSPAPRQIFAIGLNYFDHAAEAGLEVPSEPSVFTKFVSSFAGADIEVALPAGTVDWEVELAVIIGRHTRNVSAADAWSYIAGLTVGQDLSERGLQLTGNPPQYSLGKSFAQFSPTGPFLVTPDELANPGDLELGCRVNGELVQKARTSQMVFAVDVLIEKLSKVATLYPGDVIFTGTPAGVGIVRTPARYLAPGDELVSYIEGIGEIRQTFVAESFEGSLP
ncbi:fumarylacetoacetate hydrolase family protein [Rhodococcus sp. D-1]|uniref:fumarylacetoacetate hydrolase family protein n=1 Tax=Rhodococcus sp. D-1 TaxID=1912238 RepID=UPI000976F959|nr:fumarylacetoacetate hydrolase family protein [Rhodococcus sp. D-1]OMQ23118.1 fumarylacetoacetate hydrolase [Rhodococcus sp. D-1]